MLAAERSHEDAIKDQYGAHLIAVLLSAGK
jgi:hypothetical protein